MVIHRTSHYPRRSSSQPNTKSRRWRRRRRPTDGHCRRRRRDGHNNALRQKLISGITLATLFDYVLILRPPGLPCPVIGAHEIRILSKILSATLGK